MKRVAGLAVLVLLCAACGGSSAGTGSTPTPGQAAHVDASPTVSIVRQTPTPAAPPTPPPPQLCLVTRDRGVPAGYVPPDLVTLPSEWSVQTVQMSAGPARALLDLLAAAHNEGQELRALSAYRSYDEQQQVLTREISAYGATRAHMQVADPGHSEHQLGSAVDVTTARRPYDLDQNFGGEPEGRWLSANAARFGFVISYPLGKENITGYIYEPWHIRYVGIPLARQIVASGQTLTEFLPAHHMDGCPPSGA
jgi:D-alanyl-D-alanine carboxypeptidase